jgi:hypothetical protein
MVWRPNGRDLGLQGLYPPLEAELRRGICGAELEADKTRARRYADDLAGALLAHDRQHGARDVHGTDEARGELQVHLSRRQLLEITREEAGCIVDQHVARHRGQ